MVCPGFISIGWGEVTSKFSHGGVIRCRFRAFAKNGKTASSGSEITTSECNRYSFTALLLQAQKIFLCIKCILVV
jgi:hypothetical protein